MRRFRSIVRTAGALAGVLLFCFALPDVTMALPLRAEAVVLINSGSPSNHDFDAFIRPYLDNLGVPFTTLDLARQRIDAGIADYALIIVGHEHLDPTGRVLDAEAQKSIASAVRAGSGLVNFDGDLWLNATPRYQFVQDIFRFAPGPLAVATTLTFPATEPSSGLHYITALHRPYDEVKTASVTLARTVLGSATHALVMAGDTPLLSIAESGTGRAVQWHSYAWMSHAVLGPVHGLDDVLWRSIVWAARKPFVMQVLPPIVTMRVDDAQGPFGWVRVANEFGLKPWLGIFLGTITESDAGDVHSLVRAGGATASVHGYEANTFFYFNHHDHLKIRLGADALTSNLSLGGRVVSGILAMVVVLLGGIAWWRAVSGRSMALSLAAGVFFGLATFIKFKLAVALLAFLAVALAVAVRYVMLRAVAVTTVTTFVCATLFGVWQVALRGALIGPGDWPDTVVAARYAQATRWHTAHDIPVSRYVVPHFYEFGTNVFAGLADWGVQFVGTQVAPGVLYGGPWLRGGPYRRSESGRSDTRTQPGYYADYLSVPGHPEYDGRFFNCVTEIRDDNGYEWSPTPNVDDTVGHGTRQLRRALDSRVLATLFTHEYYIADIPETNWRNILRAVTANVAAYRATYMTVDDACQFVRALHTSAISQSVFEPRTGSLLITLSGHTDITTSVTVFTEREGVIDEQTVSVAPFSGTTQVSLASTQPAQ